MKARAEHAALRFWSYFLGALALVVLLLMLLVVVLHAAVPSTATGELAPLLFLFAGASVASLLVGLLHLGLRYPEHRKTMLVIALITLGLLAAHLYTIDTPPLSTASSASGSILLADAAHVQFSDGHVSVSSQYNTSSGLTVEVTAGGSAISSLDVALANTTLPSSHFSATLSTSSPLRSGETTRGSWALPSTFESGAVYRLTVSYQYLTCYSASRGVLGCVMDEVYYVPAAQTLLSGERCAPYADNCNLEHPFLSKAFVAAGIAIFGDNAIGWRSSEVLLGTASIPLLFAICWVVTKNARLSLMAAYLLAFETLFFVHSSIAVIDVHAVFFALLAFLLYFLKKRLWKLDGYILAGAALGLAGLSKETSVFFVAFLVAYNLVLGEGSRRARLFSTLKIVVAVAVVFAAGLQLYDSLFAAGSVHSFLDQVRFIISYGSSLTGTSGAWTDKVFGNVITPVDWILFYSPIGYLITTVNVNSPTGTYSYVSVGYYGITNAFEVWLTFLWVWSLLHTAWRSRKAIVEEVKSADFRLAVFALVWFAITYGAYFGLWAYGRVTYPYYMIQSVPAIAIGGAYLLSRPTFSRAVAYILLAGVFAWFFIYYPDKSFLPVQLRVLIGR